MGPTKLTTGWAAAGQSAAVQVIPARLSVEEAADYCGVSASYLNKMRGGGDGPTFIRLGRRVTYDTRDLDSWLSSGRRGGPA